MGIGGLGARFENVSRYGPACAFRGNAADSTTGKKLYSYQTGAAIFGPPTSYQVDGRQYVVMPSGSTLTAFALPVR